MKDVDACEGGPGCDPNGGLDGAAQWLLHRGRMSRRTRWERFGVAVVVGLAISCESLAKVNESCLFNDDCAPGLLCAGRRCRTECRSDRDCTAGQHCKGAGQDGRHVCLPAGDPGYCTRPSDCGAPFTCGGNGRCAAECVDQRDCGAVNASLMCVGGQCLWPEERDGGR